MVHRTDFAQVEGDGTDAELDAQMARINNLERGLSMTGADEAPRAPTTRTTTAMKRSDDLTRRQLLTLGAQGLAGGLAAAGLSATAEAQEKGSRGQSKKGKASPSHGPVPQIPRRVLGKTGRSIPILLVGGSMRWDRNFDQKMPEALRFGANYFDSARNYEGSEIALANFHTRAKVRDKIWITSKSKRHDPAKGFEKTLAESLARLKTDHVEMYYLHGLKDPDYLDPSLARKVAQLKKAGKIQFFGFSCHNKNVAELLQKASKLQWIDSVMFRYNFREYGNKELNKAIDAAHKANIGLIAMKTQGSEASFRDAWKKFEQTGKWNKYQAVLKAVWQDERITAAVSEMDTFGKLGENIAAALDKRKLSAVENQAIERYAQATRAMACDGCDHICGAAIDGDARIADTIRYLMYHDVYDKPERARELYRSLPQAAQDQARGDFRAAEAACPHGVKLAAHMARAAEVLGA